MQDALSCGSQGAHRIPSTAQVIGAHFVKEHVPSHLFQVRRAEADALAILVNVGDETAHPLIFLEHVLQMQLHMVVAERNCSLNSYGSCYG